jgi:DNA polymerase I-like protein with 3'-5' exonuclease and polymerase domains
VDRLFVETGVFKIVNQSHDSIVSDVPREAVDDVKEPVKLLLERPLVINGEEFTIPVDVEIGEVWGELEAA